MADGSSNDQLEQDFEAAQGRGRWLSEEEQRAVDQQREHERLTEDQAQSRRRRLMVLTGVCILLPPFWPLAFALTCYLLFPATVARIGVAAGVLLIGAVVATCGLMVAATSWLLRLLG